MKQGCECCEFLKVAIGLLAVAVLVYLCVVCPWMILLVAVAVAVAGWLLWEWCHG